MKLSNERWELPAFWVYDHEYRAHTLIYGNASVVDGWLHYCDGSSLHVCGHHITAPGRAFTARDLDALLASLDYAPQYVNVWGTLGADLEQLPDWPVRQLTQEDVWAEVATLPEQGGYPTSEAGRAARSAHSAGYRCNISADTAMTPQHYLILDNWYADHYVARADRAYTLGCIQAHALGYTERVDISREGTLEGFAYITQTSPDDLVYLLGFFHRAPAARSGDSFMAFLFDQARLRHCTSVHLGYSFDENLRRFKRKWGGVTDSRTKFDQIILTSPSTETPPTLLPREAAIRHLRWMASPPA